MKRADFKENSSTLVIGRWVIFLGIIITASLSFTLGFFVGKSNRPPVEKQALITPIQEASIQKNTAPDQTDSSVKQPQQPTQPPSETQISSHENKQAVDVQESKTVQQTKATGNLQPAQEIKSSRQTQKTAVSKDPSSAAKKYSVQIGAFRNSPDAKAMKTKFEKKGYKTLVITTVTKKHEKIYKVLLGEFTSREEAQLLSIKIKNTEGLKTFVTTK